MSIMIAGDACALGHAFNDDTTTFVVVQRSGELEGNKWTVYPKRTVKAWGEGENTVYVTPAMRIGSRSDKGEITIIDYGQTYYETMLEAVTFAFTLDSTIMVRIPGSSKMRLFTNTDDIMIAMLQS